MIFSMTGFGRAECHRGETSCVIELRSVNNRYMDISLRLPKKFNALMDLVKKEIRTHFSRGSFEISLTLTDGANGESMCLKPNLALARQYLHSLQILKKELKIEGEGTLDSLLGLKDILIYETEEEDPESLKQIVAPTLAKAMDALKEMRAAEGKNMASDISRRLETIRKKAKMIQDRQPGIIREYRDRLSERIATLAEEINLDPGRKEQEAAIFADRADVTEEVTRLASHLDQFQRHLQEGGAVGRKLGFILQEMNREANTLSSKVPDYSCSQAAIEIKCEIEKIREQTQNIE